MSQETEANFRKALKKCRNIRMENVCGIKMIGCEELLKAECEHRISLGLLPLTSLSNSPNPVSPNKTELH